MATRRPAVTLHFFPAGDDLPLFSGAPLRPQERPFHPQVVVSQEALFDMRPDPFHTGGLCAAQPTEEVTHEPSPATDVDPDAPGVDSGD